MLFLIEWNKAERIQFNWLVLQVLQQREFQPKILPHPLDLETFLHRVIFSKDYDFVLSSGIWVAYTIVRVSISMDWERNRQQYHNIFAVNHYMEHRCYFGRIAEYFGLR